jgi:hypothetical protein
MDHPEIAHQNNVGQILESKTDGEKNYKDDEQSVTNCLIQSYTQVF